MKVSIPYFKLMITACLIGITGIMNLHGQQESKGFSYQAVARDQSGAPIPGQDLTVIECI